MKRSTYYTIIIIYPYYVLAELHDSVLLWAYGVNRTVERGFPPDDGVEITRSVVRTTFQGVLAPVYIDENGDRLIDMR